MANSYYDATGVLVLDTVTPVITALFSGFNLDASYPGNGEAYIARISEDNDPSWDDVLENLNDLAESLSLSCAERDGKSISAILQLLSGHFNAADDDALRQLIEPLISVTRMSVSTRSSSSLPVSTMDTD